MTSQVKFVGSLGTKDFLNIMIGDENRFIEHYQGDQDRVKILLFNIGVENRVKFFREKTQENLGMKTWIRIFDSKFYYRHETYTRTILIVKTNIFGGIELSVF